MITTVPLRATSYLELEYKKRREKNPAFSMRAMARLLDLPPGRLSELMAGKRRLTRQSAEKIASRLGYSPAKKLEFLSAVLGLELPFNDNFASGSHFAAYQQLSSDAFEAIADWYHFAILALIETKSFKSDFKWISRRLGISVFEARSALERLERLELIERGSKKGYRLTGNALTTTQDIESAALKKSHRQSLERALASLEEVKIELRDITSVTMAIDIKKIPQAKSAIKEFRRKLCALLEDSENRNEVYDLNIQLVPLTKELSLKEKE